MNPNASGLFLLVEGSKFLEVVRTRSRIGFVGQKEAAPVCSKRVRPCQQYSVTLPQGRRRRAGAFSGTTFSVFFNSVKIAFASALKVFVSGATSTKCCK